MSLTVGELSAEQWPEAMSIASRAFLHQPFIRDMFGDDLVARFSATRAFYLSTPWAPGDLHLGAFVGGALVGAAAVSPAGQCYLCDPEQPDDAVAQPGLPAEESAWLQLARATHLRQPSHGRIGRMVVEPVLQGAGVGRALMAASLGWLRSTASPVVILECEGSMEEFYLRAGFERVAVITSVDDDGEGSYLMRLDLEVTPQPG